MIILCYCEGQEVGLLGHVAVCLRSWIVRRSHPPPPLLLPQAQQEFMQESQQRCSPEGQGRGEFDWHHAIFFYISDHLLGSAIRLNCFALLLNIYVTRHLRQVT